MSYTKTFITVAPDCPVENSEIPTTKRAKKTKHRLEYELLTKAPYRYDHKELIFEVYLIRNSLENLVEDEKETLWEQLFTKGHPCLRASALTKRYGFGAHYNAQGKIAIYPIESATYQHYLNDETVKKIPAMRSKRQ